MKRDIVGLDLVHFKPDFSKSPEENLRMYREAYRQAFGEYPSSPSDDEEDAEEAPNLRMGGRTIHEAKTCGSGSGAFHS